MRCCRCSSSTSYRSHRSRISRALAPRWPVSRRLTLEELIRSRSATCSAVQPFPALSALSMAPSSRRRTVGLLPVVGTPVTPLSMGVQCNTLRRESWLRPPPQPQNWHLPMSIAKVTIRADPGSVLKTRSASGQQVAHGHRICRRQAGPNGGEEAAYGPSGHGELVARASPSENTQTPCDGARRPGHGGGAGGKPEHKKHGRCSQHRPCQSHRNPARTRCFSAEDHVTDVVPECKSRCH